MYWNACACLSFIPLRAPHRHYIRTTQDTHTTKNKTIELIPLLLIYYYSCLLYCSFSLVSLRCLELLNYEKN